MTTARHSARRISFGSAISLVAVAISCTAFAQNDGADIPDTEPIDEITVVGKKSLIALRSDMHNAEDQFLDLFSALNSDDDFDFKCEYYTPINVRRRYRVCMPKFVRRAQSSASSNLLQNWHLAANQRSAPGLDSYTQFGVSERRKIQVKEQEMRGEMLSLIDSNPEFRDAFNRLMKARNAYEEERKRRSNRDSNSE